MARRNSAVPGVAGCTMKASSDVANWITSGPVCGEPAVNTGLLSVSKPTCTAARSWRSANASCSGVFNTWMRVGGRAA